jgi:hypothetical protein
MNHPVPLVLKCTVTGNEVTYTDPEYIKARIDAAGGLDKLRATYVSKAGKRQQRESQPQQPKSSRTWKGEKIITDEVHQSMHNHPANLAKASAELPSTIQRLFLFEDGGISMCIHPRQSAEQKPFVLHDHRRDKAAAHWTQKDRYYAPFFAAA